MPLNIEARDPATDEQVTLAEFRLGFRLPAAYRNWLKITNGCGVRPGTAVIEPRGTGFLSDFAPVERLPNLRREEATHAVPASYLVISLGDGGAVAIKAKGDDTGSVWWVDLDRARSVEGWGTASHEFMIRLADNWYSYLNLDFGEAPGYSYDPVKQVDYYLLSPEAAASSENTSVIDTAARPPIVHQLHCLIGDDWQGDELLACYPTFVITARLAEVLLRAGLGSFEIREARISFTAEVVRQLDGRMPPIFRQLEVTGIAGRADLGLTPEGELVVSRRAADLLRIGELRNCYAEHFSVAIGWRDSRAITSQVLTLGATFRLMIDSHRDRGYFQDTLRRLDSKLEFALCLEHLPTPKWPGDLTDLDREVMGTHYLQCAGSAQAMTCEISTVTDGVQRLFTIGRPGRRIGAPSVPIVFRYGEVTVDVYPSEVFDADEAADLFYSYHRTRSLPAGYELRHIGP